MNNAALGFESLSNYMDISKQLIVALDIDSFIAMKDIVGAIGTAVSTYKIGHQLFIAEGFKTIRYLKDLGKDVCLDLKLHEIPNSVASAVLAAGNHGVDMITVHASGGKPMMQAAVKAAARFADLKIVALTVVTGLSDQDLADIGFALNSQDLVVRLAKLAQASGCHGVIASPREIQLLRMALGNTFLIVTPGIRPLDHSRDDQHRIGTPQQAIRAGASFIVVGRPITRADNPALAAQHIIQQMLD